MADLMELVIDLDVVLVGKTRKEVEHTARSQAHLLADPTEFSANQEYHLSDGGYSRIVFSNLQGPLFLTSNSRDQVKARLNDADVRAAAARVENLVRDAVGFEGIGPASSP